MTSIQSFRLFSRSLCLSAMLAVAANAQVSQSFIGDFPDLSNVSQEFVLSGAAVWEEQGYVVVTPGAGGLNGGFFTNAIGSGSYEQLQISFDLRLSETSDNGGADGYGFALLPTAQYGSAVTGNNPNFSEEVNLADAFGLGFDTFDNEALLDRTGIDETEQEPATGDRLNESSVSVHWDGTTLGSIWGPSQDPPFNFESADGSPTNFNINLFIVPEGDDSNVTLTITNKDNGDTLVPFASLEIPGMNIQDYRIGFRGRTGGAYNKQEVGNVVIIEDDNDPIELTLGEPGVIPTPTLLDVGTPFFGYGVDGRQAGGQGPLLAADGEPSGEVDGHLSLTQALGGEQNYITFVGTDNGTRLGFGARTGGSADTYQIDNVQQSSTASTITTDFDFRAIPSSNADGFSVVLVNTEDYPEETIPVVGSGTVDGWGVAEDPLLAGGLGIGFKTFEADQIRLRYDGQVVEDVDEPIVNVVSGEWSHATVIAEACERDATEGLCVTVTMEGVDANGAPAADVPFDDVFIANASLGNLVIGPDTIPGDINGDGQVNAGDLNIIGSNWQQEVTANTMGDLTGDGIVNAADLNIVGSNWQAGVPARAAVPEPAAATLTLFGLLSLLALRRRQ